MRIVVPYVPGMLRDETAAWAAEHGAKCIDVSLDVEQYWLNVAVLWSAPEDLIVVEQDVVPPRNIVASFASCGRPWCCAPYPVLHNGPNENGMLGCTRFRKRLMVKHPLLMGRVGKICDDGVAPRHWVRLDTRINRELRLHGYRPHLHARATHLHNYPDSGRV